MRYTCTIIMLLVIGALAGCGNSTTAITPDGGVVTVSEDGDTVDVKLQRGADEQVHITANEQGVPLPAEFPKDVPVYSDATITASTTVPDGMNLVLSTGKPVSDVAAFYQKELKAQGWAIEATTNMPTGSMIAARKEKRTVTAMIAHEDETTTVSLMIVNK